MGFKIATREQVPLIIALAGNTGSGKTYSALKIASTLAEGGKVGFIDTENGRGSLYADLPSIKSIMPNGMYYIDNLREPFTPRKFIDKIKEAIKEGMKVLIVDSITPEWEGTGGCLEMQEELERKGVNKLKSWTPVKMEHKKLMNLIVQLPMHIIFCVRATDKVDVEFKGKKIQIGGSKLTPIQEKNFMYDMTLSLLLDNEQAGKPKIIKCPEPLLPLFKGDLPQITEDVGKGLLKWFKGGKEINMNARQLAREMKDRVMEGGKEAKTLFWKELTEEQRRIFIEQVSTEDQQEINQLANDFDNNNNEEVNNESD